jgi:hypothetical protein
MTEKAQKTRLHPPRLPRRARGPAPARLVELLPARAPIRAPSSSHSVSPAYPTLLSAHLLAIICTGQAASFQTGSLPFERPRTADWGLVWLVPCAEAVTSSAASRARPGRSSRVGTGHTMAASARLKRSVWFLLGVVRPLEGPMAGNSSDRVAARVRSASWVGPGRGGACSEGSRRLAPPRASPTDRRPFLQQPPVKRPGSRPRSTS